jgi:hypothetical protein
MPSQKAGISVVAGKSSRCKAADMAGLQRWFGDNGRRSNGAAQW